MKQPMLKRTAVILLLVFGGLFSPVSAMDDTENLMAIQSYLNASKGMTANFEQMDVNGIRMTGAFYLFRPGRLRFYYDAPSTLQIFSDGKWLVHYDGENQEYTTLALSETPASFFVADPINLRDENYKTVLSDKGEMVSLTLSKKDEPDLGSLTLTFKKNPLTLVQWVVIDGQGLKTVVNLFSIKRHDFLKADLFSLPADVSLPR